MDKIISYEDYKTSLADKKINELFQGAIEFDSNNTKLVIKYPINLSENDNFFFFVTNYAQRYFQEKIRLKFNLKFKDLVSEKFDIKKNKISYKGKPFISMKEGAVGLFKVKEYNILD